MKTRSMRMSALMVALLATRVVLAEPTTVPSADDAPTAEMTQLVTRALSDDATQRDAATQSLLDAGEDALPAITAARAAATDPDAQVRLDTLLVQVKERADIGGTKVTLQCTDLPVTDVLQQLGKQAHTQFLTETLQNEFGGQALPRPTLDLKDVSFWKAVREIQDSCGVLFMPQGDQWRVSKNFGQQSSIQGDESGAFLVQPTMATYGRSIAYAKNFAGNDGERFSLQFQMLCEPKVKLATGMGTVTFDRAVDSNGNDLLAGQRFNQISMGANQNIIMTAMPLKYPKNPGATIAEIRGTIRLSIARRTTAINSDDLYGDRVIEKTVEGVKFRVSVNGDANNPNVANPNNGNPQQAMNQNLVNLTVVIDGIGDGGVSQRLQNFAQLMRITDARGAPLRLQSSNCLSNDGRRSQWQVAFMPMQPQQPSGGPYKLRMDIPTGFRALDVPFSMRDMKMP